MCVNLNREKGLLKPKICIQKGPSHCFFLVVFKKDVPNYVGFECLFMISKDIMDFFSRLNIYTFNIKNTVTRYVYN